MDAAQRRRRLVDELLVERYGPPRLEPARPPWPVEAALAARCGHPEPPADEYRRRAHLTVLDGGKAVA